MFPSFFANDFAAVRPYVFEMLMYLVDVHAQVCEAAEPLLPRTLHLLVEELASEALHCFRQVKRFGMGGMLRVGFENPVISWVRLILLTATLQAMLEIEFIQQTLKRYVTPAAAETLKDLYNTISQAYTAKGKHEKLSQESLAVVKKVLEETRHHTGVGFLCFRSATKSSSKGSSSSGRSRDRDRSAEVDRG